MTFEIEVQILKMTMHQKSGNRIKTPSSKLAFLVSSCWEKNFIRNNAHNFFILSLVFLKLLIVSVAFFLGHPVYHKHMNTFLSLIRFTWLNHTKGYVHPCTRIRVNPMSSIFLHQWFNPTPLTPRL